jgi:hypothetical protein
VVAVVTAPATTEAEFMAAVIDYAHLTGWLVHHCRPARGANGWSTPIQGDAGFPDLVLARWGHLVLVELKRARPRPLSVPAAQLAWLKAGDGVIWSPEDWPEIERVLR